MSRASISRLSGRFRISVVSFGVVMWCLLSALDRKVVEAAGAGADAAQVGAVDVQGDGGLVADVADAVDVAGRGEGADLAGRVRVVAGLDQGRAVVGERIEILVLHAGQDAEHAPGHVV